MALPLLLVFCILFASNVAINPTMATSYYSETEDTALQSTGRSLSATSCCPDKTFCRRVTDTSVKVYTVANCLNENLCEGCTREKLYKNNGQFNYTGTKVLGGDCGGRDMAEACCTGCGPDNEDIVVYIPITKSGSTSSVVYCGEPACTEPGNVCRKEDLCCDAKNKPTSGTCEISGNKLFGKCPGATPSSPPPKIEDCDLYPYSSYCPDALDICKSGTFADPDFPPTCWDPSFGSTSEECSRYTNSAYPQWKNFVGKYLMLNIDSCVQQACSDCVASHLDYVNGEGPTECSAAVFNICGSCCEGK